MAITLQGWSSVDWARAANTTLAKYMRDVEPDILRNFQMLALLESGGRVSYNNSGRGFGWPIQFKLHRVEGNTGETVRQFSRVNLWKWANLDFRGYQVTDAIYNRELLENRGQEGIIKIWDGFVDRLQQSLRQGLATEPYIDGNATGNETSWHGLESMFGLNGTVNVSTGAQRSANAADYVGYPSDTYAGLSTQLGTYGGENESGAVWPLGVADPEGTVLQATSGMLAGRSVAQRDWFIAARERVYVGDVHEAKLLATMLPAQPSGEPTRFIDFAAGIAVLNTGHRHPKLLDAMRAQLDKFTHTAYQIVPYANSAPLSLSGAGQRTLGVGQAFIRLGVLKSSAQNRYDWNSNLSILGVTLKKTGSLPWISNCCWTGVCTSR